MPSGGPADAIVGEVIDFHSRGLLSGVFKTHAIDRVVSVLYAYGHELVIIEGNMLEAALDSGVRRFSPSYWAMPIDQYALELALIDT